MEQRLALEAERVTVVGLPWRAIVIGMLLLLPNAYWVMMMELVRYAGHPSNIAPFANVVFIVLVLLCLNPLLRLLRNQTRWSLFRPFSPTELMLVYLILSIGTAWVGHDGIQVLMPQIVYPFRYASPENRWEELFLPLLPKWLYVSDKTAYQERLRGWAFVLATRKLSPLDTPASGLGEFLRCPQPFDDWLVFAGSQALDGRGKVDLPCALLAPRNHSPSKSHLALKSFLARICCFRFR
jgi:hypothetical protein